MSEDVESAYEVDALIVGQGDDLIGIFSGGVLPHVAVPDAPAHSIYYRTNGEVYKVNALGSAIEANWADVTPTSVALGVIPFCNANGSTDNIALTNTNEIPFFDSNGVQDNIGLT